jgi:metal-sulfur cluster biosynthetic enzyme
VRAERLSSAEDQAELEDRVRAALCTVIDPEVGLSLVDLGFVHSIVIKHPEVNVVLALPEPQCPFIEYFVDQIRRTVKRVDGIERVLVTFLDGPATELTIEEPEMI